MDRISYVAHFANIGFISILQLSAQKNIADFFPFFLITQINQNKHLFYEPTIFQHISNPAATQS